MGRLVPAGWIGESANVSDCVGGMVLAAGRKPLKGRAGWGRLVPAGGIE